MNADAQVSASTRRMLWRLSHSMYILKTRFTDTGIEAASENILSKNHPRYLSKLKYWFLTQRLSLIYLVKEQLVAETSQQRTACALDWLQYDER